MVVHSVLALRPSSYFLLGPPLACAEPCAQAQHVRSERVLGQSSSNKDGFGSDSNGHEFGYHYLSYFSANLNRNTYIVGY
jgi:hypothetical protein